MIMIIIANSFTKGFIQMISFDPCNGRVKNLPCPHFTDKETEEDWLCDSPWSHG